MGGAPEPPGAPPSFFAQSTLHDAGRHLPLGPNPGVLTYSDVPAVILACSVGVQAGGALPQFEAFPAKKHLWASLRFRDYSVRGTDWRRSRFVRVPPKGRTSLGTTQSFFGAADQPAPPPPS